ncbi:sensor histidine kinase [Paracraurococcus ruber]|uniref:histidine kinase n=1 Tax=Paracraurococcus ruber TaxID=77675 RepID=A0ABS1CXC7_9PROT|nr:histidine kinase dimerization/phosphoacceptor domain -containing protein [Paracraurococcus ruber]MBK1659127.1 hypothetical protein [Paracraurococcus ruber]TDG30260.1 PAS domain S-box protein [Paracraurococcus ruber]
MFYGRTGPVTETGRRGPSLRAALFALTLLLAGGVAGLAAVSLWQAQDAAQRQAMEQLLGTARAMALGIDREFARAEALLQGLALFPSLRAGDPQGFIAEARPAAERLGLPILGVAGPDGRQLASSLATPAQIAAGLPAAPEVMAVFRTGRTSIGDFTEGNIPNDRRIVLGVPVRAEPAGPEPGAPAEGEGEVRYGLGIVLPRERLLAALMQQRLPDGWVATLTDRTLTIVARTSRDADFAGRPVPAYLPALVVPPEGVLTAVPNLDGDQVVLAYAYAPVTGYLIGLAMPMAILDAARWAALGRLGWLVLPVVLAGLGLASLLARQVGRGLRRLAMPDGAGSGLQEVAELGAALAAERRARDAAEVALRERSAWLEAAQQAARVGVWQQDLRSGRVLWSAGMRRILRLPATDAEAPGDWQAHLHPDDQARIAGVAAQRPGGGPPFDEEFRVLAGDGTLRWVRSQGVVERDAAGQPLRALGAWIDITARKRLEEEREALLKQQEFLAGEIHHRVKNSLQLVLSLLLLQARRAPPEAEAALRDAARRVGTVAAVHRRLYEEDPEGAADVGRYLAGLVEDLRASLVEARNGRDLALAAEPGLRLAPEHLAAVGIVATELVTNALKYGRGTVMLRLARGPGGLAMAVEDAGPGFPEGFDPAASRGLGMRVALTLTRQAGGQLALDRAAPGGRVVVTLPEAPAGR